MSLMESFNDNKDEIANSVCLLQFKKEAKREMKKKKLTVSLQISF